MAAIGHGTPVRFREVSELCEAMGRSSTDRLVIFTMDGLGRSHAANAGVYSALRRGLATSAGLMVPAPWARHAAARCRGEQVGLLLTLIAESDLYRWGPVTSAPSLLDGDGGFPRTLEDLWDHADLDEVFREAHAQIERAILWGFDVTYLSSHLGAMERRAEFFGVYLELAEEYRLPVRLPSASDQRSLGVPLSSLAAQAGVLSPDHVVAVRGGGHPLTAGAGRRLGRSGGGPGCGHGRRYLGVDAARRSRADRLGGVAQGDGSPLRLVGGGGPYGENLTLPGGERARGWQMSVHSKGLGHAPQAPSFCARAWLRAAAKSARYALFGPIRRVSANPPASRCRLTTSLSGIRVT